MTARDLAPRTVTDASGKDESLEPDSQSESTGVDVTKAVGASKWLPWSLMVGFVVSAGSAALLINQRANESATEPETRALGVDASPAGLRKAQVAVAGELFPVGAEQTYAIDQSARVATESGQDIVHVTLHGQLQLVGLSKAPTTRVHGQFKGRFEVAGQTDGTQNQAYVSAVEKPFVLEFLPDGSFVSASGSPETPPFVGRIWSALGEFMQLTRSAGDRWQTRESDASGSFLAAYELHSPVKVSKRKIRYEQLPVEGPLASLDVLASSLDFEVDSMARLERFEIDERTRAAGSEGSPLPSFVTSTRMTMQRTDLRLHDNVADWLALSASVVSFDTLASAQTKAARDQQRMAGMTLKEVMRRMQAFAKAGGSSEEREDASRAYVAFAAMVRSDPGMLDLVRQHLTTKDPLAITMLAALRDASTPASQKLLASMTSVRSPLDLDLRMEAARALSHVPTPTAETVQALKAMRADPELGTQGTYGLGSALYRLKGADPALASQARTALSEQLSSAADGPHQAAVLTAIGNAGDPQMFNTIRSYADSSSEDVRAAVAQALRRIPGTEAEPLLAQACSDGSVQVRYSAVDAIGERPPAGALSEAVSAVALNEPEFQVRAKALGVLTSWYPSMPNLADTLKTIANGDQNADLRLVAQNALNRAKAL